MALILVIRSLKSSPMVLIALAQVQILSAAPMVLLRIMVALLGIVNSPMLEANTQQASGGEKRIAGQSANGVEELQGTQQLKGRDNGR